MKKDPHNRDNILANMILRFLRKVFKKEAEFDQFKDIKIFDVELSWINKGKCCDVIITGEYNFYTIVGHELKLKKALRSLIQSGITHPIKIRYIIPKRSLS